MFETTYIEGWKYSHINHGSIIIGEYSWLTVFMWKVERESEWKLINMVCCVCWNPALMTIRLFWSYVSSVFLSSLVHWLLHIISVKITIYMYIENYTRDVILFIEGACGSFWKNSTVNGFANNKLKGEIKMSRPNFLNVKILIGTYLWIKKTCLPLPSQHNCVICWKISISQAFCVIL